MMRPHFPHQIDPVALFEAEFGDHHVRIQPLDGDARLACRLRFPAYGEIVLAIQDAAQAFTHDWMIVDDQHAANRTLVSDVTGLGWRDTKACVAGCHLWVLKSQKQDVSYRY